MPLGTSDHRCEMTDLAATPLPTLVQTERRLIAEEDAREQIAYTAAFAKNYQQLLVYCLRLMQKHTAFLLPHILLQQ